MIDEQALKDLIQSLLGDHITVDWQREPEHWPGFSGIAADGSADTNSSLGAQVTLSMTSVMGVGTDDMRRTYNALPQTQTIEQVGLRHVNVQALVECGGEISAPSIAERIITGFQRRSTLNALRELGCALRRVAEIRGQSVPAWDNKYADGCVVEIDLTWGSASPDPIGETGTEVPHNWIETLDPLTFTKA